MCACWGRGGGFAAPPLPPPHPADSSRNPAKTTFHWSPSFSVVCAGIFKQSMGARNRVGIGLSYRPARLHLLTEMSPWNRFWGSLKV